MLELEGRTYYLHYTRNLALTRVKQLHVCCVAYNAREGIIGRDTGATIGRGYPLRKGKHDVHLLGQRNIVTAFAIFLFTLAPQLRCM